MIELTLDTQENVQERGKNLDSWITPDPKTSPNIPQCEGKEFVYMSSLPVGESDYRLRILAVIAGKKTSQKNKRRLKFNAAFRFIPKVTKLELLVTCLVIDGERCKVKEVLHTLDEGTSLKDATQKQFFKRFQFVCFGLLLDKKADQALLEAIFETVKMVQVPSALLESAAPKAMLPTAKKRWKKAVDEGQMEVTHAKIDKFATRLEGQHLYRNLDALISICDYYQEHKNNLSLVDQSHTPKTFTMELPHGLSSLLGRSVKGNEHERIMKQLEELFHEKYALMTPVYPKKKGKNGKTQQIARMMTYTHFIQEIRTKDEIRDGKPYTRLLGLECNVTLINMASRMVPDIFDLVENYKLEYKKRLYPYHYQFIAWCYSTPCHVHEKRSIATLIYQWGLENKKNPKREQERLEELLEFGEKLGLIISSKKVGESIVFHLNKNKIPRLKMTQEIV